MEISRELLNDQELKNKIYHAFLNQLETLLTKYSERIISKIEPSYVEGIIREKINSMISNTNTKGGGRFPDIFNKVLSNATGRFKELGKKAFSEVASKAQDIAENALSDASIKAQYIAKNAVSNAAGSAVNFGNNAITDATGSPVNPNMKALLTEHINRDNNTLPTTDSGSPYYNKQNALLDAIVNKQNTSQPVGSQPINDSNDRCYNIAKRISESVELQKKIFEMFCTQFHDIIHKIGGFEKITKDLINKILGNTVTEAKINEINVMIEQVIKNLQPQQYNTNEKQVKKGGTSMRPILKPPSIKYTKKRKHILHKSPQYTSKFANTIKFTANLQKRPKHKFTSLKQGCNRITHKNKRLKNPESD